MALRIAQMSALDAISYITDDSSDSVQLCIAKEPLLVSTGNRTTENF